MIPKIIADDREDARIISFLKSFNCEVEIKRLLVGDFICSENTAIERKTRNDFESSIIDKRLFYQLQNLKENYKNVILIIEGESNGEIISREALMGAYASLITDFQAGVFFTRNFSSSAELIYSVAKHEQIAKKLPLSINSKRKTHTLSQTQRSVVEAFPMVGPKLAKSLLEHFGSLENVINAKEKELLKVEKFGEKKSKIFRKTIENEYLKDEDPI
ncbi:MAG: ERCC4 domain-containing protein [Candidatus Micrarchaeia archaeon]